MSPTITYDASPDTNNSNSQGSTSKKARFAESQEDKLPTLYYELAAKGNPKVPSLSYHVAVTLPSPVKTDTPNKKDEGSDDDGGIMPTMAFDYEAVKEQKKPGSCSVVRRRLI